MKKIIINSLIAIFIVNELIKARSSGIAGVTSFPGENNCHNCHGDYTTNSGTGSVTISTTIPAAGYTLGQTYSVSVTVARTASTLFGFDCEALTTTNTNAGTLAITDAASTKLMTSSGKTNVVHTKNGGLVSGSKTFTFSWTAPATNVGTVTFYVSGLCCNNNGNESGDYVYTKSAAFSMAVATATVTTGTISGSTFCQGQTGISVPYTVSGTFNTGNVFTAQLSDASGSFTTRSTLGTLTSTTAGTIVTTIGLPALAGTGYRIRLISSNPAVTGTDNGANLTISLNPTTANAGTDQTVCATTATLAGNTPTVGTGTWTLASGAGTITTPSSPSSGLTALGTGQNKFVWTIANGTCTPSRDTVIINVSATPTMANAGVEQIICATTATLAGNTPTVGTGTWTLASGAGTITTPSSPSSGLTALGSGQSKFVWTITNGTCTPSSDTMIITRNANPTIANAGTDQTACTNTATLSGNTPATGTGTWTLASGSGTITNPSSPITGVTGLSVGQNKFVWTISNAPCASSSDTVIITQSGTINAANAGVDQSICTSTTTLSGNTPTVGSGTRTVVSGSGTVTTPSSPTSGVSGLSTGQNIFVWSITNSSCTPSRDTVIVIRNNNPTIANAGTDQTACTNTAILSGNSPSVGTGIWTVISGSASISNANNATTTVTNLSSGQVKFVWTINNPPCGSATDTMVINTSSTPTPARAGNDQTICGNSTSLSGNTITLGTGTWTLYSGSGTIASNNNPATTVNNLNTGVNIFIWTSVNGYCPASKDTVKITVYASPTTANAGSAQSVCENIATLNGNTPVAGIGSWSLVSGSGTISYPGIANTTVTNLGLGTNIFRWTISNAPCADSYSDIAITYNSCAATITTSTALTGSPFCSNTGYSVSVPFTTTGTFTGSFTAQLSDASGSFANPVIIGTSSTSPISAVIPASTPEGYGYLIRVVNSNSSTIGTDNTVGLLINTCKEIHTGAISAGPYCSNTTFSVSVPFTTIGNVTGPYIIELSDSTGSFDYNPLTIGFGYSSPIMAYFPSGLLSGSHYRIRIVSDYDGVDGSDNGGDILINTCTITALFNHKNLQLQFYPNPNDGKFSIVPDKSGEAQITVLDVTGNVIFEQKVNLHINQHYPLQLENMSIGLYFIKVSINEDGYMGSFIKE